jgi:hypothetical protein
MIKGFTGKTRPSWIGEKITKAKLKGGIPSGGDRIRGLKRFAKCRKTVLLRDCFTCQICFGLGMTIHHIETIKKKPELSFNVSNLVTLCASCHDKKVSKHEEEWEDYFKDRVLEVN